MKYQSVVLFSGGLDSTAAVIKTLEYTKNILTLTFDYGQKNSKEIDAAVDLAELLGVDNRIISLDFRNMFTSCGLLSDADLTSTEQHATKESENISFIPNRNSIFLSVAHGIAQEVDAYEVVTGYMNSGYPDCRKDFCLTIQAALNMGSHSTIKIHAPFMDYEKDDVIATYKDKYAGLIGYTYTCYNNSTKINSWGTGCGYCNSCVKRKAAFDE